MTVRAHLVNGGPESYVEEITIHRGLSPSGFSKAISNTFNPFRWFVPHEYNTEDYATHEKYAGCIHLKPIRLRFDRKEDMPLCGDARPVMKVDIQADKFLFRGAFVIQAYEGSLEAEISYDFYEEVK